MDRIKQKALIGRGVLMRVDIFLFRQRDQHLARRLLAEVESARLGHAAIAVLANDRLHCNEACCTASPSRHHSSLEQCDR